MSRERQLGFGSQELEDRIIGLSVWLGGFFEPGGSMGIGQGVVRRCGHPYPFTSPFLGFNDNHIERVKAFYRLFGVIKEKPAQQGKNSWMFKISGAKIAWLASLISPYAPSRRVMAENLDEWVNSPPEGQIAIAQKVKGYDGLKNIHKKDYLGLVTNPIWVAGAYDNRCYRYTHIKINNRSPQIALGISSVNRPLLDVLEDNFGGSVREKDKKNEHRKAYMGDYDVNYPTQVWEIESKQAREFLSFISHYSILRKQEVEELLAA